MKAKLLASISVPAFACALALGWMPMPVIGADENPMAAAQEPSRRFSAPFQFLKESAKASDDPHVKTEDGHEEWATDGAKVLDLPVKSYDWHFHGALGGRTLDGTAKSHRDDGLDFHVLDVGGSAIFTKHPELYTSLIGLRYAPLIEESYPPGYPAVNWIEVIGDVYNPSTWPKLDRAMIDLKVPSFNRIIVRPFGPLLAQMNIVYKLNDKYESESGWDAFYGLNGRMLAKLWERTNPRGGEMLVELDVRFSRSNRFLNWVAQLNASGIQAEIHYANEWNPTLRMLRQSHSPLRLPIGRTLSISSCSSAFQ